MPSSSEKMQIWPMSVFSKYLTTAESNELAPQVIIRAVPENAGIFFCLLFNKHIIVHFNDA